MSSWAHIATGLPPLYVNFSLISQFSAKQNVHYISKENNYRLLDFCRGSFSAKHVLFV